MNPSERFTYTDFPNAIVCLAKQLPQLTSRWQIGKTLERDVDSFWASLHSLKHIGSLIPLYPNLILVRALFSPPASNADSERCFSMAWKIDSGERDHLERSTVAALLSNIDSNCYDFTPP